MPTEKTKDFRLVALLQQPVRPFAFRQALWLFAYNYALRGYLIGLLHLTWREAHPARGRPRAQRLSAAWLAGLAKFAGLWARNNVVMSRRCPYAGRSQLDVPFDAGVEPSRNPQIGFLAKAYDVP